jgi:hypothetical protein
MANDTKKVVEAEVEVEAVVEAVAEVEVEVEAVFRFAAAQFPIRNPYTNVLYERDGVYEVADIEDGSDSSHFIKVQMAAGVLAKI